MSINKDRLRSQINRAVEKLPTAVTLYRDDKVDQGRKNYEDVPEIVASFNAFIDTGSSSLTERRGLDRDRGIVYRAKSISLLTVNNGVFSIKKDDYFYLDDIKHVISYPRDQYGIYWECDVEVVLND